MVILKITTATISARDINHNVVSLEKNNNLCFHIVSAKNNFMKITLQQMCMKD